MLLGKTAFVCFLIKKEKKIEKKESEYFLSDIGTDALAVFTDSIVKCSYNITTTVW